MYGKFGQQDRFDRSPPVKEGDELDVRIEAVGEKGDGVAKKDGFVLFVPNVKEGDEVRIRITKVLRKVGFAEMVGEPKGPVEAPKSRPRSPAEEKAEEIQRVARQAEQMEDSEDFGEEAPADEEQPAAEDLAPPETPEEDQPEEEPVEKAPEQEAPADEEPVAAPADDSEESEEKRQ